MEQRTGPRVATEVRVALRLGSGDLNCVARDVTREGLFVCTDQLRPVGQLVQFKVQLPAGDKELRLLAVVAHVLTEQQALARGRLAGMGLTLRGVGPEQRKIWEDFVEQSLQACLKTSPEPAAATPGAADHQLRRQHARCQVSLEVLVRDGNRMLRMPSRDISIQGLFLQGDAQFEINRALQLQLVHPLNGEKFALSGKVVHTSQQRPELRGVGVEFVGMTPDTTERFESFLETSFKALFAASAGRSPGRSPG